VKRRLLVYRLLLLVWGTLLLAALYWLAVRRPYLGVLCIVLAVVTIGTQALLVCCPRCGTRPGRWLLAVWMLFVDLEGYVGRAEQAEWDAQP
jgi:hypothetical protein